MTVRQPIAPSRSRSGPSGSGVGHVTERHHDHFTVVGNHLAQHPDLSLVAIGLATHIQSLPPGSPVGIKAIAARFPEGEIRIAAALRELEAHGYLARRKERLPSGRVVTRTFSYNKPRAATPAAPATAPAAVPEPRPDPGTVPVSVPAPAPTTAPGAPPVSAPRSPAADLLCGLRALDSRLLLSERDVLRLVPAVQEWLARGVPAGAVQRAVTAGLPDDPIRHPAGFLARRLAALLPPPLPATPRPPRPSGPPGSPAAARRDPLQNCPGCERAFRAPGPGRCRGCRAGGMAA
ncbi:helix-turn-helix domain-containing protein [Streptomyces sp. NPDC005840]|uniref:helix-turn-helix domain-containing protein n=1 Tax=Streptomyces sp. NPDC005840 TaxID=3157072 RepID=UPI0033CC063A